VDGTGNNLAHPTWGGAGTDLLRISPAAYADGVSAPSLPNNPSARALSNLLNDQTDPNNPSQDLNTINSRALSDFAYVWGQFIDHDMSLTPDGGASFPIPVAAGDPIGPNPLPFTRSQFDPKTGTGPGNPRQQVNAVTSFLDLSQVYGSDAATASALRTHSGGRLKTSPGSLLPYDNATYFGSSPLTMQNSSGLVPNDQLFAAGDVRANENIELTALQTLFLRNHNRIAAQLQAEHPHWTDEQLYQEARKLNIATEEMITYNEFLPAILGPHALPAYRGYNPNVNPAIATEFSTVGFRFGHSLLSGTVGRNGNNGLDIADVNPNGAGVDLAQSFFDPNLISANGATDPLTGHTSSDIGAILKADGDNGANEFDLLAIRQVRNLLFGPEGAGGEDLIARDIQRARDHGIGDYNTVRAAYGLPKVTSFAQITSNVQVQRKLQQAFGSVDHIDAFEGMLAEDHVAGSDVGPLTQAILVDQFTRLRDGDRFFYQNERFNQGELLILQQGDTLARVIMANTDVTNLQDNVFFFKASIGGTVSSTSGAKLAGVTVQLQDDSGNVLATTVTDGRGHYRFDQFNGIGGTGNYNVRLVVPSGDTQTSANPATILISRGDLNVRDVDFTLATAGQGTSTSGGSASGTGLSPAKVDALFAAVTGHHRSRGAA
jgi:hypothetical protein